MFHIVRILSAPGARKSVTRTAKWVSLDQKSTQVVDNTSDSRSPVPIKENSIVDEEKPKPLDRRLDAVVAVSGSIPALVLILVLVLLWALMGIRFGTSKSWQVLISDVQALLCYVLDSFLMRQQLNSYDRDIRIAACMQSRSISVRRLLCQLQKRRTRSETITPRPWSMPVPAGVFTTIVQPSRLDKLIGETCDCLGHLITLVLFWLAIFIWLGFGAYCRWSETWQLYINSATSALMIVVFALLTRLQEQHKHQIGLYLRRICELDSQLEAYLRCLTGDNTLNTAVTIDPLKVGRLERAISYYADLVGTLVGVCLLMLIMVVWVVIGPPLHFDSNWWLIIGTYAGLIGLHDGFVLHNIRSQLDRHSRAALVAVLQGDAEALAIVRPAIFGTSSLHLDDPESADLQRLFLAERREGSWLKDSSLTTRLCLRLASVMSHQFTVLVGIVFIFGLLVGASALKWSTTAQLLCNIPPSIAETFVMMALISRERWDWCGEAQVWHDIGKTRIILLNSLKALAPEAAEKHAAGVEATIDAEQSCFSPHATLGLKRTSSDVSNPQQRKSSIQVATVADSEDISSLP